MGVLAILRDITERKRAEEALRQAEEKYHTLVDCMQDGAFIVQDGKVRFANEAFAKMLDYTVDELSGTDLREIIAPEDVEPVMERYHRRMAGEVVPQSYELRMLQKDQRTRIITELNVRLSTFQDQPATMGTVRNITMRKQAQEEKETLQEQLFQARKREALGTLAGGVAHDFNNILSAIMGFTELATDEVREGSLARRNLEEVLKASRRAKALVQQILTFSRPSPQNRHPTQPQPILEEVLTSLRASFPPTIELRHHFDNTAGPVTISASQLQQILTNLCTNAIQALGSRGGVIEIHSQRINVERDLAFRVKNLSPGPYMTLTISDTGCGMPSTIQERIFEPFFTTRPVGEGNGLGLAIVHGIVTGHGGAITVDSTPGEGTTFVVYLPASTHEITSADMPHHSVSPAATTRGDGKGGLSGTTDFSH